MILDCNGANTCSGGESIRDMQNQTGCKINVSPASGRDIEREIGLIGSRHAIDAAKRAIMEKVDVVVCDSMLRHYGRLLTWHSVLEHKLVNVKVATTMQTGTPDSSPVTSLPRVLRLKQLHRLQPLGPQTHMLPMVATRTTSRCGMQLWHNSNRVAKVSNAKDALSS